jgi:undecaprenyl-diphosphatase
VRPWQEAVLGAVQGAAEVYPVSSSGQLSLLPWLARWQPPADRTRFAAGLHAGSAVGLAVALRHEVRRLTASDVRRLLLSSAPAAVVGLVAHDAVEKRLGTPGRIATALAVAGAALWWADSRADPGPPSHAASHDHGQSGAARATPDRPRSWVPAPGVWWASLAQAAALVPGVSRTGATLTALRAAGTPRDEALRTSLLMSLPVAVGAAGLTAVRGRQAPPAVPTALAAATAYLSARRVTATRGLVRGSVLYRLGLAALVARRLRKERP